MKNTIIFVFLLTLASCNEPEIIYPESKKVYLSEKIFGHEIDDNYRWLEDFTSDDNNYCAYDLNEVRALASDKDDTYKRMNMGVAGGWITISEARKAAHADGFERHHNPRRSYTVSMAGSDS